MFFLGRLTLQIPIFILLLFFCSKCFKIGLELLCCCHQSSRSSAGRSSPVCLLSLQFKVRRRSWCLSWDDTSSFCSTWQTGSVSPDAHAIVINKWNISARHARSLQLEKASIVRNCLQVNSLIAAVYPGLRCRRLRRAEPAEQRGVLRLLLQPVDRGGPHEGGRQLSGRGQLRRQALCHRRRPRRRHLLRQGGKQKSPPRALSAKTTH